VDNRWNPADRLGGKKKRILASSRTRDIYGTINRDSDGNQAECRSIGDLTQQCAYCHRKILRGVKIFALVEIGFCLRVSTGAVNLPASDPAKKC